MNSKELYDAISEATGIPASTVGKTIRAMPDVIVPVVVKGGTVEIVGIGKFALGKMQARTYTLKDGKGGHRHVQKPAEKKLRFLPAASLKTRVKTTL